MKILSSLIIQVFFFKVRLTPNDDFNEKRSQYEE